MASGGRSFIPSPASYLGLPVPKLDIEDSLAFLIDPLLRLAAKAGFLSFGKRPIFFLLVGVGAKVLTMVFSAEAFLLFFYPLPGVASFFLAASTAAAAICIFFIFLFLFLSALAYFYKILSCFINNNCFKIIRSLGSSTALIAS